MAMGLATGTLVFIRDQKSVHESLTKPYYVTQELNYLKIYRDAISIQSSRNLQIKEEEEEEEEQEEGKEEEEKKGTTTEKKR